MFKHTIGWLCAIALVVSAAAAHATFHLWTLSEVYSNADGTVQFIELRTSDGGQQFVAGQSITSSQGASSRSFAFPSDLPGDSAGRTFLIGTTGFAALGLVTPDYIVPNGFLFTTNGRVNFANVDSVSWIALPVDGVTSIDRSGATAVNSPTNFAGQTASIPVGSGITPIAPSGTLPVYRFLNTVRGVHFYTASEAEKNSILATNPSLALEGIAFYAFGSGASDRTPVYRFLNNVSGVHFYTASEAEKNSILATIPSLALEGISYYAMPAAGTGLVPLYRFLNTLTGVHFYTASEAEKNSIVANIPSLVLEGIAYYVRSQP